MERSRIIEAALALSLVTLAAGLLYPFDGFMLGQALMTAGILFVVAFSLFAGVVWRERVRDEREIRHRELSGRVGFLAGAAVLVAGILVQSARHELDPWLVTALVAMVVAKLTARSYVDNRR